MKKYAIIGLGFIAPRHKQAIERTGGRIEWVCDTDVMKDTDEWNNINFTTDYRVIEGVDYAIVCTPNDTHIPIARHFADKGVEVLVEKPPAIRSEDIEENDKINVVLQLRHHPEVIRLKKEIAENDKHIEGSIVVKVKRDQPYWDGWKGKEERSGGILFNLGVHYIELLQYLFDDGTPIEVLDTYYTPKQASGIIKFGKGTFSYHFEIMPHAEGQTRSLLFDGEEVELSNKDNLSYEDLHTEVYEDMLAGKGVKLIETKPVIELIERLRRA